MARDDYKKSLLDAPIGELLDAEFTPICNPKQLAKFRRMTLILLSINSLLWVLLLADYTVFLAYFFYALLGQSILGLFILLFVSVGAFKKLPNLTYTERLEQLFFLYCCSAQLLQFGSLLLIYVLSFFL